MKGDGDSIKGLLKHLDEAGGHIIQITPRDRAGQAIFTLLLIEHPDEYEIADIKAMQEKWDAKADATT